jgi:hypothetical protein
MDKPTVLDLIDLLTMSLEEISSVADNLAEVLYVNRSVDKNIYNSAYAIKTMILDLEKKSVDLGHVILDNK